MLFKNYFRLLPLVCLAGVGNPAYSQSYGGYFQENYTADSAYKIQISGVRQYDVNRMNIPYKQMSHPSYTLSAIFALGSSYFGVDLNLALQFVNYLGYMSHDAAMIYNNFNYIQSNFTTLYYSSRSAVDEKRVTTSFIAPMPGTYELSFSIDGSIFTPTSYIKLNGVNSNGMVLPQKWLLEPKKSSSNWTFTTSLYLEAGAYFIDAAKTSDLSFAAPPSLSRLQLVGRHQWIAPFLLDVSLIPMGNRIPGTTEYVSLSYQFPNDPYIVDGTMTYSQCVAKIVSIANSHDGLPDPMDTWNEGEVWQKWAIENGYTLEYGRGYNTTLSYVRTYRDFTTVINDSPKSYLIYNRGDFTNFSVSHTIFPDKYFSVDYNKVLLFGYQGGEEPPAL